MSFFLIAIISLLPIVAQSQVRGDAASINFINYDHRGDQAFEARTGTPPIRFGEKTMLINTITLRQVNLSSDNVPSGQDLKLSDYGVGSLLLMPAGKWTLVSRLGVNFANATSSLRLKRESTFITGVVVGSRTFASNPLWKYSLGVVLLGRGSRIPAVPAASLEYESEGQVYQLQLGFPIAQATYGISNSFRVGLFTHFTSNSYLLPENSAFRAVGDYIGVDRIVTGTLVRARLNKLLWLNTRLGYTVYGKTTILNGGLDERRRLDEESGLYVLVGLGIAIPRL